MGRKAMGIDMSVFEEACYLSNQRWINSLPTEFEPIIFSKKHEKTIKILFDKMRGGRYHRLTRKVTAALIAAILIVSMTVTAFAIPASRDYIIHRFFDHSTYSVVNGEQNDVGEITIGYIPDGFKKTYEYIDGGKRIYAYKSNDNWFDLKTLSLDHKTDIDTESQEYESIIHNGIEYVLYEDNNSLGCIWNNGYNTYIIIGNISKETILKIAFSIE